MKRFCAYVALVIVSALPLMAQPVVNAIENNYSYIPAGLPSYGIAQGSIFVIFGSNLAQNPSGLQSVPLKTSLDGVTVQFSVQGTTTQALLYYVTPTQIGGILPSATPVGTGTVTVTNGGQSSAALPLNVVQSAIGIFGGPDPGDLAAAWDGSRELTPHFYAANPGETITFYGTGAGPVSGDEAVQQTPQDLADIPLEVDIGGVSAKIAYHGRSQYPGLDQFNVVVPQGPVGCDVSVLMRSGNYVSNSTVIPVASNGRDCSDPDFGTPFQPAANSSSAVLGFLSVAAMETIQSPSAAVVPSIADFGGASFQKLFVLPGVTNHVGIVPFPSLGGCIAGVYSPPTSLFLPPMTPSSPPSLDAGPHLNFTGPAGAAPVQPDSRNVYEGSLSLASGQPFIPQSGGAFTIDNGSGGNVIGGFQTQLNFPPPLAVSNAASLFPAIDRSQPLTVQWTGGDPNGFLLISGHVSLPASASPETDAGFVCTAPIAAGQFTVPASILMTMPAVAAQPGTATGPTITVESLSGLPFTAPGMDAGVVNLISNVQIETGFE